MKVSRFEDLNCRQEARALTKLVYTATGNGAFKKDLRLSSQIQAAASSVMANIAEGFCRKGDKEFIQFLYTAMASTAEVQSHLYVARDVGYPTKDEFGPLYEQAGRTARLISGLIKYPRSRQNARTKPTEQTE